MSDEVTELQNRVADLTAEIEATKEHIQKLNRESQDHRLKYIDEKKKVIASNEILKAHGVKVSLGELDYQNIEVDEYGVIKNFEYIPPRVSSELPAASGVSEKPVTMEDLGSLSEKEINARFDEMLGEAKDD